MADKDLEITCPSIEKPFYINHDSQSYFVSNYLNESHFQKIIASSGKKELSTINRLNLIRNYVLLEQTMKVPTVKNMEILKSFKDEDDFSVWEAMAAILASSRRLVFSTPAEAIHKKFAAKLVGPLVDRYGWESSGAESSQVKKLRQLSLGLAASAEMPEIINEGLKRFDSFKQPSQLEPDIRSVVYYCGARFGSKDEFSKLLALYQTDLSAEEKEEICCALTVVRDEPKILRLLEFINQPTVRLQDTATWFAYLIANPYSRNLAWLWLKDNFDSLRVRYGGDPTLERYPRYAAAGFMHTSDLSDYKNFFNGLADDVRYSRTIKLGIQDIEARIAWREANQQPIIDWLNSMAKASKL